MRLCPEAIAALSMFGFGAKRAAARNGSDLVIGAVEARDAPKVINGIHSTRAQAGAFANKNSMPKFFDAHSNLGHDRHNAMQLYLKSQRRSIRPSSRSSWEIAPKHMVPVSIAVNGVSKA